MEKLSSVIDGFFSSDSVFDAIAVDSASIDSSYENIGLKYGFFNSQLKNFIMNVTWKPSEESRFLIWRYLLILSCMARILRGELLAPMHGAILKRPDGRGIVVCGQSGMGKSTIAQRWKEAGGICPADDMMLLECSNGSFYVHPMPTWSRLQQTYGNEFFSASEAIPVVSFLALDRGEKHETLALTDDYRYLMSIYSGCGTFLFLTLGDSRREPWCSHIAKAIQQISHLIYDAFPHKALFAVLDDQDIMTSLKECIE